MKNKKTLGFTLIELLVSVSILTILSGAVISIINNSGLQSKARDSQRIADLKKIQVALELYFSDNRSYIAGTSYAALSSLGYLSQIPLDPSPPRSYGYNSNGSKYVLYASMEIASSVTRGPCGSLPYWPAVLGSPPVNCYGVVNP